MKNSQAASLLGVAIGALLFYFAFNSGERVIVGEMEDMRPIFGHVLNKPMLAAGIGVAAASLVVFGLGFRGAPVGSGRTDASGGGDAHLQEAGGAQAPASEPEIAGEPEAEKDGG